MKPSLVLFTAITLLLPVGLASHSTAYDSINKTFSHSTRQGESQRGMGNGLLVLPGGWHDGEVVKRQARQGRVPAISRSTSEPTGDAIPHPQPNCVCDLRNTGGVAGFGSDHGWSVSKANMRSLAHAGVGCGTASANGGDCGSGALGSGLAELGSDWLNGNTLGATGDNLALQYGGLVASLITGADANDVIAGANRVDSYNRRLHPKEAKALKEAQENAEQDEKNLLKAIACSLVKCSTGIAKEDGLYETFRELQDSGDALKNENPKLYQQLKGQQKEGLFGYSNHHKINDFITSHEQEITSTKAIAEIVSGGIGIAGGISLCASGIACTIGLPLTGLGAIEAASGLGELIGQGLYGYDYKEGQGVSDSFRLDTHQGHHDPLRDLGIDLGKNVALSLVGGVAIKHGVKFGRKGLNAVVGRLLKKQKKQKKWVPNPYGSRGGPEHQKKIKEIIKYLVEEKKYTHVGGGGLPETTIPTKEGRKTMRRPDITVTDRDGNTYHINVGKQTKSGQPIARERQAMEDILNANPNASPRQYGFYQTIEDMLNANVIEHITLIPYN